MELKTSEADSTLQDIDKRVLWHPFTHQSVWSAEPQLVIERGDGFELIDVAGNRYLDGVSSLWCNVHGHSVPELVSALQAQAGTLCHSTLLGLSHRPIVELGQELVKRTPSNLTRAFFADAGTTAVEAGLRIGLEWWQKTPGTFGKKKRKLVSLEGAYHGDTVGAVTVGFLPAFHAALEPILAPALRTPPPHWYRFYKQFSAEDALQQSIDDVRALFERESDEIAAFFIEPLVQGAAGIWVHPEAFLQEVAALCKKHDVLLITDEVATGFGKTGSLFAVERAQVEPDILILGKGLSAGYAPISVAMTTEALYEGFLGAPEEGKTFFYGQTYAGNPLAAEVSLASLALWDANNLLEQLPERISLLQSRLQELVAPLPCVDEVRQCGLMVGVELTAEPGKRKAFPTASLAGHRVTLEARKRGVIIRPLGNVMILMPAPAMPLEDIERLVRVTAEALDATLCS